MTRRKKGEKKKEQKRTSLMLRLAPAQKAIANGKVTFPPARRMILETSCDSRVVSPRARQRIDRMASTSVTSNADKTASVRSMVGISLAANAAMLETMRVSG